MEQLKSNHINFNYRGFNIRGHNLIQRLNENIGFNECKSRTIILLMQYVIKSFLINEIHKNNFSTNIIETTIGG